MDPLQVEKTQFMAFPSVSFRSNYFTIRRPMLVVWQMPTTTGHGNSDSSRISTLTSLPEAGITAPATVTAFVRLIHFS